MDIKRVVGIGLIVLIVGSLAYTSCNNEAPKPQPKKDAKPQKVEVVPPSFDADSAFQYIEAQVKFGPRVPNSKSHVACGDWIIERLKASGAVVTSQQAALTAYDGTMLNARNIIASFQPEKKERVLLCAHWDTRPYSDKDVDKNLWKKPIDGANDGGSGVGVLLEVARLLKSTPTNVGVDIIFFDAEDYGSPEFVAEDQKEKLHADFLTSWCLGSQYWARNKHKSDYNPRFGILLDMVGASDAQFNKEEYSMGIAPDVVGLVWNTANKLGYGGYFQDQEVAGVIDDHIMLKAAGIRCIDIIDTRPDVMAMGLGGYRFGSFHHTHKDNIDIIDKATLKAVGQTVLQVIYNQ